MYSQTRDDSYLLSPFNLFETNYLKTPDAGHSNYTLDNIKIKDTLGFTFEFWILGMYHNPET